MARPVLFALARAMAHFLLHPLELLMGPLSATVRTRPEVALVLAGILALALVRGTRRR